MLLPINTQHRYRIARNLGSAARVQHQPSEGLEEEATVVALEEGVGQEPIMIECGAAVELLSQGEPTALALTLRPVKELELPMLGSELVMKSLNQFEMELRV